MTSQIILRPRALGFPWAVGRRTPGCCTDTYPPQRR